MFHRPFAIFACICLQLSPTGGVVLLMEGRGSGMRLVYFFFHIFYGFIFLKEFVFDEFTKVIDDYDEENGVVIEVWGV